MTVFKKGLLLFCLCLLLILSSCSESDHNQSKNETTLPAAFDASTTAYTASASTPDESTSVTESAVAPTEETTFNPFIHYVPESEWSGLETRAYDDRNYIDWGYIASHPEGTPDPKPYRPEDIVDSYDIYNVSASAEKTRYSLKEDNAVKIVLTYSAAGLSDRIPYDYYLNIDRWNGTEWERMLYVPKSLQTAVARSQYIKPGESITKSIVLSDVITKLTPGTYRAIAYFNYRPVYAEFELTE